MDRIVKQFGNWIDEEGNAHSDIRVTISVPEIREGLIAELGTKQFAVFLVLVSYMNKNNSSFPSLNKIGELTGVTRQTVSKAIISLEEAGLIEVVKGAKNQSYEVLTVKNFSLEPSVLSDSQTTDQEVFPEIVFTSAKDIAHYFASQYEKQFGSKYMINYTRDLSMIKKKLADTYTDVELQMIIDTAIRNYKTQWANANYPLPTISMLCSWLSNTALAFAKEDKAEEETLSRNISDSEKTDYSVEAIDLF